MHFKLRSVYVCITLCSCVGTCVQEAAKARTDLVVNFREVLDSMTRLSSAYYFLCEEGELVYNLPMKYKQVPEKCVVVH